MFLLLIRTWIMQLQLELVLMKVVLDTEKNYSLNLNYA